MIRDEKNVHESIFVTHELRIFDYKTVVAWNTEEYVYIMKIILRTHSIATYEHIQEKVYKLI